MFVYWIHKPEHIDPRSEGYVGISKDPSERMKQHTRTKGTVVYNALKKYDNIQLTILHENVEEGSAKLIETIYRPNYNIGWNICPGGGLPPCAEGDKHHNIGRKHSQQTKRILSEKKNGSNHWNYGKHLSEVTRRKIGDAQRGALNHAYGKKNTKESNEKRSKAMIGKQKHVVLCPHCLKSGGKPAMIRFHFENCKERGQ